MSSKQYKYIEKLGVLGDYHGTWLVIQDGVMQQCNAPDLQEVQCIYTESLYRVVLNPTNAKLIKEGCDGK